MYFKHPSTCVIAGPSQSGKTTLVRKMIHNKIYENPPKKILWCYSVYLPFFQEEKDITFMYGLPESVQGWDLIIIDDLMHELSPKTAFLFTTESHHCNVSVILIMQNLFPKNKIMRDISLNTHYLILFKNNRDESQVNCLGRQAFAGKFNFFMDAYKKATEKDFGYLLLDFHPKTDKKFSVRDSCFPDERGIFWIYLPIK